MGRPSIKEERRRQIALALMQCMKRKSYFETTTKDIAEEAGLATGLIHYYFPTKDDVLYEMLELSDIHRVHSLELLQERMATSKPIREVFYNAFLDYFRHYFSGDGREFCIFYTSIWTLNNFLPEVHARLLRIHEYHKENRAKIFGIYNSDVFNADEFSRVLGIFMDGMTIRSTVEGYEECDRMHLAKQFINPWLPLIPEDLP